MTEGRLRSRTVVLEFPSYEAALACYRSPDYQAAKELRQGKAEADLVVIEAYDGTLTQRERNMAKGYWIGRVEVNNEEGYKPYAAANPAIFKKFGAQFVVRGGKYECQEGAEPLAQCGDRISGLCDGRGLLSLAGIPGQPENPPGERDHRSHHRRGLRRPAAVSFIDYRGGVHACNSCVSCRAAVRNRGAGAIRHA